MKIAYNPITAAAVITAATAVNDDILFDLKAKKIWAKGLRMGADWADITSKPSSLKNPAAIKFKDINGNDVSYDGSAAKDLTSGTYIAKLPYGFHSFTSGPTWGNTEGTSIACWNDSSGGSIDFRKDNPSSGKMSIKVDGRVYVNDGKNPVLSSEYGSGFWGMRTPDGGNDWIRTSNNGLIPYIEGTAGKGHSSLGTNNWYFSTAYIDKVYGSLKGRADTATTADTALSANKLTTARNIALGTDLRGSANFDGSGNITINATINSCQVSVGAKDTLPFKRIAHFETTSSYNDNALLLYISEGYINGRTGICRIEFRTNNIATDSTSITASAAVRWLVRNGYGLDSLYAGYYVTANKAYIDVYLKTGGGYKGTVIRVLQDSRGSINSAVQLISAKYNSDTDHKEAYSSVEAASTSLYGKDYTKIVSGVDAGTVGYANSTGSASSATKLQTARNLWGQSFDGTADVKGALSGTGSITPGSAGTSDIGSNSLDYRYGYFQRINAKSGTNLRLAANNSDNQIVLHTNGNVGIGTNSPSYKLQVNGNVQSSGFIKSNSSDAYVLLGGGGHKAENSLNVANADKLDNWHKDNIQWTGYISSNTANLQSYWFKMYDVTITSKQSNDITITFLVSEGYGGNFSIFYLKVRQNGTNGSGAYNLSVTLRELVGNLKDKIVAYYNNTTGNVQLWGNVKSQYGVLNYTILKKTERFATDFATLGTLTAKAFDTVQAQPTTDYTKVTMSRVGQVQYAESSSSSTQTTQLQTARNLWGNSFNGTKDIDGSIIFPAIADTATSNKISWSGSSDGADIYYQTTAKDQGNLVLNVKDDTNAYIQLALNGTFKSHFDVANSYWTGRSARADKWTTARTLTIGNSAKSVDGSGNVSWTLTEIGAAPSGHTHAWNSLTHNSTVANQAILTTGTANGWKLETLNIANWNTAYKFVNSISGSDTNKIIDRWDEIKNFLAGITGDDTLNTLLSSKLSVYELADNTDVSTLKNNGIYYSTTDASTATLTNSPFNNGFALINMTSYDGGDDLRRSRLAFNGYGEMKVSNDRGEANTAETWYNVLTSKNSNINGSTITLNGTSITVYSSGTADGRYVKKSGDTMSGGLTIATGGFGALTVRREDDGNGASIQFRGKSNVYGYIGFNGANKDKQLLRWDSNTKVYTILDTSTTNVTNGKGVINGTTITQVDNATNATNASKLVKWYSARPASLNTKFGDGSLRIFHATSTTTEGKPQSDATVLHLAWDNDGGWDSQLALGTPSSRVYSRSQNKGTWQPWHTLAFTTDIPTSLKNPHTLTLKANGTTLATYDGSSAKEANFTYANVGAASANHNHDTNYVRRWDGIYGIINKFLAVEINEEKGWLRIEVSDSDNATTGGYGIYMIGWNYHGNNGTDNLVVHCLYANNVDYVQALKVIRTSRNNYDIYFQFKATSAKPAYTVNYHKSSIVSLDYTVTTVTEIPTATWTSSLAALQLNASSTTNADKLDGYHANGLLTALSNSNRGISLTVGGTTKSLSNISVGDADTVDGYHALDGRTFNSNINWAANWNDLWSDGTNKHPWYGFDHRYVNTGVYSTTLSDYFGLTLKTCAGNISITTQGNVGIGLFDPKYKLQVAGNVYASAKITSTGFVHSSVTKNANQYVLTADGGYTFLNQASNELAHEFSRDITVTSEWTDIAGFYGGSQSFLTQPGTYVVQVYYESNPADGMYQGYFSGIMSWYTGKTNSNNSDEIVLHRVGHAYSNTIYLRTRESLSSETQPYTKLQISANSDLKQHTYKFKFKRIC